MHGDNSVIRQFIERVHGPEPHGWLVIWTRQDKATKAFPLREGGALEAAVDYCAERAAHEIAWMREEGDAMVAFAREVAQTLPGNSSIDAALTTYESGRSDSLHLDDVSATYSLAGHCFSAALEHAVAQNHTALHLKARAILDLRLDHENRIKGEWAFVGRA